MDYQQHFDTFILDLEKIEKPLDIDAIFNRKAPLHLEIGCGRGEFIAGIAATRPEYNFLGLELRIKRVKVIARKLGLTTHQNVRLAAIKVDANVRDYLTPGSVDVVYIQHPDPWPKRRHHKHRIIQHPFLDAVHLLLKPGGALKIATDHPEYAEFIQEKFANRIDFSPTYVGGYSQAVLEQHIETYYENKWKKAGYEPVFMFYKKV